MDDDSSESILGILDNQLFTKRKETKLKERSSLKCQDLSAMLFGAWCKEKLRTSQFPVETRPLYTYFNNLLTGDSFDSSIDKMIYTICASVARLHPSKDLVEVKGAPKETWAFAKVDGSFGLSVYTLCIMEAFVAGILWPTRHLQQIASFGPILESPPAPNRKAIMTWLAKKSDDLVNSDQEIILRDVYCAFLMPTCVSIRYSYEPLYYTRYKLFNADYISINSDERESPGFTDNITACCKLPKAILGIAERDESAITPLLLYATILAVFNVIARGFIPSRKFKIKTNADAGMEWCEMFDIYFAGNLCYMMFPSSDALSSSLIRPHMMSNDGASAAAPIVSDESTFIYHPADIIYAWLYHAHQAYPDNVAISSTLREITFTAEAQNLVPMYL